MNRREFPTLSRYTYGTGDIGLPGFDEANDRELVGMAVRAGIWLHSSPDYGGWENAGGTFRFLRRVFDELGCRPKMVVKLFCSVMQEISPEAAQRNAESIIKSLGVERIDLAQLPCHGALAEDIARGGPTCKSLDRLRDSGLVGGYVAELTSAAAADAMAVVRANWADGYILYWNPIECEINAEIRRVLAERGSAVLALRTLGRIFVDYSTWDSRSTKLPKYSHPDSAARIDALRPIFEKSGCGNWLEFCMRFAMSVPNVRTTIGMTTKPSHLRAYLAAATAFRPMDASTVEEIEALHDRWSKDR